jgi:hypothetical protein
VAVPDVVRRQPRQGNNLRNQHGGDQPVPGSKSDHMPGPCTFSCPANYHRMKDGQTAMDKRAVLRRVCVQDRDKGAFGWDRCPNIYWHGVTITYGAGQLPFTQVYLVTPCLSCFASSPVFPLAVPLPLLDCGSIPHNESLIGVCRERSQTLPGLLGRSRLIRGTLETPCC